MTGPLRSLRGRVALAAIAAATIALVLLGGAVTLSLSVEERRAPLAERLAERFPRLEERIDTRLEATDLGVPTARSLAGRMTVIGIAVLVIVGVAGLGIGGVALEPLARLRRSAADIAATGNLDQRLPRTGPTEVDELADTLNAMLARLRATERERDAALAASRRFAADAGHELRTPLTAMRADLDVLAGSEQLTAEDRAIVADLQREQDRLTALVEGLLLLARGGSEVPRVPLDLAELADRSVITARRHHPHAQIELVAPPQLPITGWMDGLRIALDNLLDNALRYGPKDVHVRVTLAHDDHGITLTVDDDGPGIDPLDRDRVLERFQRGRDASPGGSGLGLALVAQQATLHHGHVELLDSPFGGTRARLYLAPDTVISPPEG